MIRERRIRERGEDLEGVFWFLGKNGEEEGTKEILKERGRKRKLEDIDCFGEVLQGNVVVGNFGLGGQETARIHGGRELERLFLVGWDVNIQFWTVWAIWERT